MFTQHVQPNIILPGRGREREGNRIRCPGANSARFPVTHRPPKAVPVNKTLVPTIAVPLLSACHSIFHWFLPRTVPSRTMTRHIFERVKKRRLRKDGGLCLII